MRIVRREFSIPTICQPPTVSAQAAQARSNPGCVQRSSSHAVPWTAAPVTFRDRTFGNHRIAANPRGQEAQPRNTREGLADQSPSTSTIDIQIRIVTHTEFRCKSSIRSISELLHQNDSSHGLMVLNHLCAITHEYRIFFLPITMIERDVCLSSSIRRIDGMFQPS